MVTATDPFGEFHRLAQRLLGEGTTTHPTVMPMDAWRDENTFVVELDVPGVSGDAVDIEVERNVLTVTVERPAPNPDGEMLAAERPFGVFSRQLVLGDDVDPGQARAEFDAGVLRLSIPVIEKPQSRKIEVQAGSNPRTAISS